MILKFLNASLKRRIFIMFATIALMVISDMVIIHFSQQKTNNLSHQLQLVYQNKSSIESLASVSKRLFRENEFDVKENLLLGSARISRNINMLLDGGAIDDSNLSVPEAKDDFRSNVVHLKDNWLQALSVLSVIQNENIRIDSVITEEITKTELIDTIYQDVTSTIERIVLVPNPKIKAGLVQFDSYKQLLFEDHDRLANTILHASEKQQSANGKLLMILLIINIVVIVLFLALVTRALVLPLSKIGYLTNKVVHGEEVTIKYKRQDEIGEIVSGIHSLGHHLRQASDFVHHIGEGNLDVNLKGLEEEQEKQGSLAHSLVSMQQKLRDVSKKEQIRSWTTQGLAKFAEILRHNRDLQSLGDAVLAEFVNYTEANIGCIYIHESEANQESLKLVSFYAYDTKKHFKETLEIGEGVVGQTFVEKKATYLLEIPEDYTDVKSGVGTASPKSIYVVPLLINDEIYGVLELASLREFPDEQREFIQRVAETIAGTINNVKNVEKTRGLLEESQQMTEQMRAQEEEMRQNMEELSATQEEIARKEVQMTSALNAFDQAVPSIEIDCDGFITNANQQLCAIASRSKQALIGTPITSLVDLEFEHAKEVIFSRGESVSTDITLVSSGGEQVVLEASISPTDSDHALIVAYPKSSSDTALPTSDLDAQLSQHISMLDITQQLLNNRVTRLDEMAILFVDESNRLSHSNQQAKTKLNIDQYSIGHELSTFLEIDAEVMNEITNKLESQHFFFDLITLSDENEGQNIMLYIERQNDKK